MYFIAQDSWISKSLPPIDLEPPAWAISIEEWEKIVLITKTETTQAFICSFVSFSINDFVS